MSTRPASCCALILPGEFRSRRLGEGDARNEVGLGLAVILDGLLRQRQIAGDVDDVEGDRACRQGQLGKARAAEGGNAGGAGRRRRRMCAW